MHVLDQEAKGLAWKLRSLSLENRRHILAEAFKLASETITGLEPAVHVLLKAISDSNMLSETQVAEAKSLAETADERYLNLQEEQAPESEWLNWFSTARLLTAIAKGFGGSSWNDMADAVYELSKTRDDPSEIITFIESRIEASR